MVVGGRSRARAPGRRVGRDRDPGAPSSASGDGTPMSPLRQSLVRGWPNPNDRIAVVTGAGSGIGREVTHALLGAGYRVALAGRREEALRETLAGAGVEPDRAIVVPTDVADRDAVAALFARVRGELGRVDLLFNNAGPFGRPAPFEDVAFEDWQAIVDDQPHRRLPVRAGGLSGR